MLEWVPFPLPGDLPYPGIEPVTSALEGRFFTAEPAGTILYYTLNRLRVDFRPFPMPSK